MIEDERRRLEREAEYKLRHARTAVTEANKARTRARELADKLARYEWDSVYYRDTHPGMAAQLERAVPQLRGVLNRMIKSTADLDAAATALFRQAGEAQAKLTRRTWKDIAARIREWCWPIDIIQAIHAGRKL